MPRDVVVYSGAYGYPAYGASVTPPAMINPVAYIAPMTSGFGYRNDPKTGAAQLHNGLDLGIGENTPLRSVAAGKVIKETNNDQWNGNSLIIDHGNGWWTGYLHMNRKDVGVGSTVAQGQQIGLSGKTGYVTGPHLHFMVWKDGVPVDPAPVVSWSTLARIAGGVQTAQTALTEAWVVSAIAGGVGLILLAAIARRHRQG